jgi:hypothetical protein
MIRLILAAAALLTSTPAMAQMTTYNGGSANYPPMAALGTSQNVQSANSSLAKQFGRIDISHNGLITRGEWGAAGMFSPDFDKLDADKDNKVSLPEWSGGLAGRSNHKDDIVAKRDK